MFDIFDLLTLAVADLLHKVQRAMHNVMSHRSINIVFTRIDFSIEKDLAPQLGLPFTCV